MAPATALGALISCILRVVLGYRQQKTWKIKGWKFIVVIPVISVICVLGAKLSAGIAYGDASGVRMYGTVLMSAILIPILAVLFKLPAKELYGFNGVTLWLSLVLTKGACIINGCCYGIVLFKKANGVPVRFPSAIVETLVAVLFFVWFMNLVKKNYPHELLFPLYMIWYGIQRYLADWLRGNPEEVKPFVLWIAAGRFFSIIIVVIGLAALIVVSKKMLGRMATGKEFLDMLLGRTRAAAPVIEKTGKKKK